MLHGSTHRNQLHRHCWQGRGQDQKVHCSDSSKSITRQPSAQPLWGCLQPAHGTNVVLCSSAAKWGVYVWRQSSPAFNCHAVLCCAGQRVSPGKSGAHSLHCSQHSHQFIKNRAQRHICRRCQQEQHNAPRPGQHTLKHSRWHQHRCAQILHHPHCNQSCYNCCCRY
jgi:hypothetical protein